MSTEERDRLRVQQIALAKALTNQIGGQDVCREASLVGLDTDEIARSSETLIRKRISQTRSALRGTSALLGDEFSGEFRIFATTHFFSGPDALWRDAIEFARWLARRHHEPFWLQDLLRWECERCLWESQSFYFSLFRLRHRVAEWIDKTGDYDPIEQPRRVNQWVLVWRFGRRGGIRAFPHRDASMPVAGS